MKKALALIAIALLVSCSYRNQEGPVTDYRKGKDGLVMSYSENTPPDKTYEQTDFSVILRLWNKGAYDNPPGRIYIGGFDPGTLAFSPTSQEIPPIQGSSQYLPGGGYDTVTFEATDVHLLSGDSYKPILMASACYKYYTLATPTVCIVPRLTDLVKNKICEPGTVTMSSQGGPIAVTRVDEEVMDGALNFIITMQNVGSGTVVAPSSLNNCPYDLDYEHIDKVNAKVLIRSLADPVCTPADGVIKLVDGKGVMSCRFEVAPTSGYESTQTSYTSQLEIQLEYGYNINIQKQIEIARIPGTKPTQGIY